MKISVQINRQQLPHNVPPGEFNSHSAAGRRFTDEPTILRVVASPSAADEIDNAAAEQLQDDPFLTMTEVA